VGAGDAAQEIKITKDLQQLGRSDVRTGAIPVPLNDIADVPLRLNLGRLVVTRLLITIALRHSRVILFA
jgi:hypothetical protein